MGAFVSNPGKLRVHGSLMPSNGLGTAPWQRQSSSLAHIALRSGLGGDLPGYSGVSPLVFVFISWALWRPLQGAVGTFRAAISVSHDNMWEAVIVALSGLSGDSGELGDHSRTLLGNILLQQDPSERSLPLLLETKW